MQANSNTTQASTLSIVPNLPKAVLVLKNGMVFEGYSFGAPVNGSGEVVFNTAMSGYQEMLTDISYTEQLLALTHPHIGNVGVNVQDLESKQIACNGLIIKAMPSTYGDTYSNFRAELSLKDYLIKENKPCIGGIDTRQLTLVLRDEGAQLGAIVVQTGSESVEDLVKQAKVLLNQQKSLLGLNLADQVSTTRMYEWQEGEWHLDGQNKALPANKHVAVYDFGCKLNILKMLKERGCKVSVVPSNTPASKVLALNVDGIMLSNGPGDPDVCFEAIAAVTELLKTNLPIFGICLGHQILALALGAKTHKMKLGHHGANHPVKNMQTGQVFITSQNHGFAVDPKTLTQGMYVTHVSLFDQTIQGIALENKPVFGFQGHPEASPGPHELSILFDQFCNTMSK